MGKAHAAVTAYGQPYTAEGFSHEAHDRHAAAGQCPVVQSSKAWCILKAGHHVRRNDPWLDHASTTSATSGGSGVKFWDWP